MKSGRSILVLAVFSTPVAAQPPAAAPKLPKIVLIGDSIRLGYAPLVAKKLEGQAIVVSGKDNGGDSANVLKNLADWVIREQPDVVHLNCGLHDLKLDKKTGKYQVELSEYKRNLRQIVERIRKETNAVIVFANTTPIIDERHAARKAAFDRKEADVRRYNDVATRVMHGFSVPVHDLHGLVTQNGRDQLLSADGTHYTPAGYEMLATAVADSVQRGLVTRGSKSPATPASGADAVANYRKAEAERDALVPPPYRQLSVPAFPQPADAAAWQKQRPEVYRKVVDSLADLPARPAPPKARLISREIRPGYVLERLAIDNGLSQEISALLLSPMNSLRPRPAILWLHSSTPDRNQLITPNTNGGATPLGEEFVRAGYVVLAPDAAWYGDRATLGPAGTAESGRAAQESLHKYHLWFGRTLWGMFVRDDQVALDYLCSLPGLDTSRIGATGMSMGSTRAWWLAAVDDRVAATVGVACLTRYQTLIAHGQLRAHGVYYFGNGLLRHFDTEGVLALIAPRPFLALTGDLDAGSPADGIRVLEEQVGRVYATLGARERFRSVLYPGVGHVYTPAMRTEMLQWFERWLKEPARRRDRP